MIEMSSNWFVITGGPSSGITATASFIATLGFQTVPEAARMLIDQEVAKGKDISEIRKDELLFQRLVLQKKQEIENSLDKNKIIFFERGIPDSLAYSKLYGVVTREIYSVCNKCEYGKVFVLESLEFEEDYARIEDASISKQIYELLKESYSELGFNLVVVPKMSIEQRAKMILSSINLY